MKGSIFIPLEPPVRGSLLNTSTTGFASVDELELDDEFGDEDVTIVVELTFELGEEEFTTGEDAVFDEVADELDDAIEESDELEFTTELVEESELTADELISELVVANDEAKLELMSELNELELTTELDDELGGSGRLIKVTSTVAVLFAVFGSGIVEATSTLF